jgi:hypothetical protein
MTPEEMTAAVQKHHVGTPRKKRRFDQCAIGRESHTWHLFEKYQDRWRRDHTVRIPKGTLTNLLDAFAQGEGYLSKVDGIKIVARQSPVDPSDAGRFMASLKANLSSLRKTIRKAIDIPEGDPLPWIENREGWVAAIEVGYAIEIHPVGGQKELLFATRSQLSEAEGLDLG